MHLEPLEVVKLKLVSLYHGLNLQYLERQVICYVLHRLLPATKAGDIHWSVPMD